MLAKVGDSQFLKIIKYFQKFYIQIYDLKSMYLHEYINTYIGYATKWDMLNALGHLSSLSHHLIIEIKNLVANVLTWITWSKMV